MMEPRVFIKFGRSILVKVLGWLKRAFLVELIWYTIFLSLEFLLQLPDLLSFIVEFLSLFDECFTQTVAHLLVPHFDHESILQVPNLFSCKHLLDVMRHLEIKAASFVLRLRFQLG